MSAETPPVEPGAARPASPSAFVALESPDPMPLSARIVDTFILLFTRPTEHFERLKATPSPLRALVFGIVSITIGVVFSALWQSMNPEAQEQLAAMLGPDAPVVTPAHLVLAAPFASVFDLMLHTLLLHGLSRLWGGQARLGQSLQIVAYASAAEPLSLLPVLGPILAIMARLLFLVRGVEVLHGLSRPKAWLICALPVLIGLMCLGGMVG